MAGWTGDDVAIAGAAVESAAIDESANGAESPEDGGELGGGVGFASDDCGACVKELARGPRADEPVAAGKSSSRRRRCAGTGEVVSTAGRFGAVARSRRRMHCSNRP